ncbi:MAG: hypothetical protein NVS1B13_26280 [Flavisolibacter sp.]
MYPIILAKVTLSQLISLIGRDMKALMFHMKANESKWEFVNSSNCPEWLTKLEKELSNLIKESLK